MKSACLKPMAACMQSHALFAFAQIAAGNAVTSESHYTEVTTEKSMTYVLVDFVFPCLI